MAPAWPENAANGGKKLASQNRAWDSGENFQELIMPDTDPAAALFELYVGDEKMALLHDPERVEMFWCSYRVEPTSETADRVLHEEATWNEVRFTVGAKDGRIPNVHTFTGGDFVAYCRRETDRLSFRSLWPIDA